jgi:tyrosinase
VSGLGGWGNPQDDFSVYNGAFSVRHLSYPSPHVLRRDFTLLPFNISFVFFTEPLKEGNASFSAGVIESILNTSAGNYTSFQALIEAFDVGP